MTKKVDFEIVSTIVNQVESVEQKTDYASFSLVELMDLFIKENSGQSLVSVHSISGYKNALNLFKQFIKGLPIVNEETIKDFLRYHSLENDGKTKSRETVKTYLNILKSFFKWRSSKLPSPNIAANVKYEGSKKEKFKERLSPNLIGLFREKLNSKVYKLEKAKNKRHTELTALRNFTIFEFALRTGLRQSAITEAKFSDIRNINGVPHINYKAKRSVVKNKHLAIADNVLRILNIYVSERKKDGIESDYLFCTHSVKNTGKKIDTSVIRKFFRETVVELGYENKRNEITFHSLRHTCLSTIYKRTDVDTAKTVAGHKHSDTTINNYGTDAALEKVAESINEIDSYFD